MGTGKYTSPSPFFAPLLQRRSELYRCSVGELLHKKYLSVEFRQKDLYNTFSLQDSAFRNSSNWWKTSENKPAEGLLF